MQEMLKAAAAVVVALAVVTVTFFLVGSIMFTLAVAVPVIIVVGLVGALLFGEKTVTIRRDEP